MTDRMASNLVDALAQTKEALLEGVDPIRAVREAAMDYGLHPDLITRKFTESNKADPAAWQERQRTLSQERTRLLEASRERARQKAIEVAQEQWKLTGTALSLAGRIFTWDYDKREYAWVVYAGDNPNYAIRAISVETGKLRNFPERYAAKFLQQIAPGVRLVA